MENRTLIFVYNADSGIFNGLADWAHKIFSPDTYACNLCALTYSNLGMRKDWRQFIETLDTPVEFLHRDEFYTTYRIKNISLPAILYNREGKIATWMNAAELNAVNSFVELKESIREKIQG